MVYLQQHDLNSSMISHWICDSIVDAFSSETFTHSLGVESYKIRLYIYSPRLICLQCSKQQHGRVKVPSGISPFVTFVLKPVHFVLPEFSGMQKGESYTRDGSFIFDWVLLKA